MSESDGKKPTGDAQPPAAKPPPAPPPGKPAPKNPGFVTVTVDGKELVAKPGTNMMDAVKAGRLGHPLLLLPPAPLHRGQLPHVPGRGEQLAQAGPRLPDADGRGDGHPDQERRGSRRASGR